MLQPVKYYYKSPFAASLDQKIHSFLSKVFLRVPGSQQSSRGQEGHGRSSFVLRGHNFRGCPMHEILYSAQRPSHLLLLPVFGEARLLLGDFGGL